MKNNYVVPKKFIKELQDYVTDDTGLTCEITEIRYVFPTKKVQNLLKKAASAAIHISLFIDDSEAPKELQERLREYVHELLLSYDVDKPFTLLVDNIETVNTNYQYQMQDYNYHWSTNTFTKFYTSNTSNSLDMQGPKTNTGTTVGKVSPQNSSTSG